MARPKEYKQPVIINLRLEKKSRNALRKEAKRCGFYLIRLIDRTVKRS